MCVSLLCPQVVFTATQKGITLWFHQILPTLLPFSIISYLCIQSNIFDKYYSFFAIISGFFFGMPIGAKLACDGYKTHKLSKETAQLIANYANNLSPSFVLIYIFTNTFADYRPFPEILWILYFTPLSILAISLLKQGHLMKEQEKSASGGGFSFRLLDDSIINSFETLVKLCGYICLFSIFVEFLLQMIPSSNTEVGILIAFLEITNGISCLGTHNADSYTMLYLYPLISFGGICCIAQSLSFIRNAGLSVKKYIKTKMLLTLLNGLQAALIFILQVR